VTDRPITLGAYPVERELGRGGMGVVYLARDPRLDRPVAIKVLPDEFARDPERLARFEREARLLASLNHPNIASIYGIEETGGQRLLVLEYIPGDTLATLTARGAPPLDEALDICRQIALAVEAAHEGGVIHRDLKPGNVKITPDGQVKVLDFGLAKGAAGTASGSGPDLSQSPTITYAVTGAGVILGTAAYMSPEQARGKPVDKRTDIWSFGCVLYECLTGRLAFGGETVSDTIAKILEREPDWSLLPAQTPATLRELLRRCLEKDARKRQRDIGDVRLELEAAIAARSTATRMAATAAEAKSRAALSPRALAVAALALVVGAAAGIGLWSSVGPGARGGAGAIRGTLCLSIGIPATIRAVYARIAPDGRTVIVRGYPKKPDGSENPRAMIYTRRLDAFELKPIPGTEGVGSFRESPDGKWLAFVATISEESSQRRIAKVPLDGSSPPVTLADWDEGWSTPVAWLGDGDLLVFSNGGTEFFRLPSRGGPAKRAIKLDTGAMTGFPSFDTRLPHDRGVFFTMETWGPRGYQQDEWLLDPRTGKARRLFESAGNAAYSPTGHVVFTRGEAIMAVPFDLGRQAVTGEVAALSGDVRTPNSWGNGYFGLSSEGSLIYPPGGQVGTDRRLVIVDASGNAVPFTGERRAYEASANVSRDGRKAAVVLPNAKGTYETWVADLDRPGLKRVLALPNADCSSAIWSADGQRLAYDRTARDRDDGIYVQRADGAGSPQAVLKVESPQVGLNPTSWAPDGSGLLAGRFSNGQGDIVFVPVVAGDESVKPRVLRATPFDEGGAHFSPDGRLVAFASNESGRFELYVASYGADGTLGPPLMVSNGGGDRPRWAGDGRRLFYYSEPEKLMSVTIQTKPNLSASSPAMVHDLRKLRVDPREWDVMPDGRIFAIQKGEGEDDITQFNVVLNWSSELRERMAKAAAAGRGR
jgi:Tol biopolymer transport system component/predicted Ser/Thr protein kinase